MKVHMYSICHIFSTYLYSQHQLIRIRDNLNLKPKSCCTIHSNKDKMVCTHGPLLRWWGCDGIPAQFLQYVWKGGHPPVQGWVEMLHHWEKQWEKKPAVLKEVQVYFSRCGWTPTDQTMPPANQQPSLLNGRWDWFNHMIYWHAVW